jgi:transposase InsO family protein
MSLFPDVAEVKSVEYELGSVHPAVKDLVHKYPGVFTDALGCFRDFKINIPVSSVAEPKFVKARPVPYAYGVSVDTDLDKLEAQGVWTKENYSKWAAPIVPVLKDAKDPSSPVRICGDYKVTVNQAAPLDTYPIPNVTDQLAALCGGKKFTKLDLSQAYQQLELDDQSKELLTISTHRGLYQPSRLQFGVHSATGIFQRIMDSKFQGIPFVQVRVDDILISGKNDADHLRSLEAVLRALSDAGLTLKPAKCSFMQPQVVYCGHIISEQGLLPMKSNVEAVQKAPVPTNMTELKSFLGMTTYYGSFLPNLSTVSEPLHQLLRKDAEWKWEAACDAAFRKLKSMLCKAPVLTHFDMKKPIHVHCDASPYGVGAVLSHIMEDGKERPVSFCSRTLTAAERNYAHIEKEGLALVFAVKKFHQYLCGIRFVLKTDHKPLLGLFAENKGLPTRAAARILRWALQLSAYNYVLEYRPGDHNANADALSRLPLDLQPQDVCAETAAINLASLIAVPVTEIEVYAATRNDAVLSTVLRSVLEGWKLSNQDNEGYGPYETRRQELSTEGGCLLWGLRVIIPTKLQNRVLTMLHDVHPGMVRMKALARSHVWWPGIDADIETTVRTCATCQVNQDSPSTAPVHCWEYPAAPWERLHIDFAGPMEGRYYLVVIDAFSKWLEVEMVASPSSEATICKLRKLFSTHGLPSVIVSDNGSAFISEEFKGFLKINGIRSVYSAPYHPASNGQAERAVRVFKTSLKKLEGKNVQDKISKLLFHHRTTPHSTTGTSPAELLLGRKIRTHLDIMRPDRRNKVTVPQLQKKLSGRVRAFEVGELVLVKNFGRGPKWMPGSVMERTGSTNYTVELSHGGLAHRHINQMVSRNAGANDDPDGAAVSADSELSMRQPDPPTSIPDEIAEAEEMIPGQDVPNELHRTFAASEDAAVNIESPESPQAQVLRRSVRSRKLPSRFQDVLYP